MCREDSSAPGFGFGRGRAGGDMDFGIVVSVSGLDSALHSFCASQFHEKEGVGGVFFCDLFALGSGTWD